MFEGHDTPYISNGSIHTRIGETSKPVAINDRYQFNKLLNKRENFKNKVNSFMDNKFFFEDNFNQPYLEFYVYVDNHVNILFEDFYSKEFFEEFKENFNSDVQLADEFNVTASTNFDNAYSSINSYILRHIHDNDLLHTGFTLELFQEGHLKLIFPFNIYTNLSLNNKYESLIYYDEFIPKNNKNLKIIDLAESMLAVQIILAQYKRLLKKYDCNCDLNIKSKFKNFNSITPFMDSEDYIDFICKNKLPINLKTSIDIPNIGYLKCKFEDFNPMAFVINIILASGIPQHLINIISEGYTKYIKIKSNESNKSRDI